MKENKMKKLGQITVDTMLKTLAAVIVIVVMGSLLINLGRGLTVDQCLDYLSGQGYIAYADNQGVLHADRIILSGTPPITLTENAKSWLEFRPDLDPTKLARNTKPTEVTRGIVVGYGLPVGGADEELFYDICVPNRWDGESDIYIHIYAWLDTAQDEAADAVKLQLEWQQVGNGDVVPATFHTVTDEVVIGIVGQYVDIEFVFLLDYDIVPEDIIEADNTIFFHLIRIASSHEIAGEPVIYHSGVTFQCDKYGNPTWE